MIIQKIYKRNNDKEDTFEAFTNNKLIADSFIYGYNDLYIKELDVTESEYIKLCDRYNDKMIYPYKSINGLGIIFIRKCDILELIMCGCNFYDNIK